MLLYSSAAFGQIGGNYAFEFLNVPVNARLAALGGVNVSRKSDVNFVESNPALLSDTLTGWISASYRDMPADVSLTNFSYAHDFKKAGIFSMSIHHAGYGTLQGYDPSGVETGQFKSGETAIVITRSHQVNNFRLGVSIKGIFSSIAGYNANAAAIDLGGAFIHPQKDLTVGVAIKNIGFLISDYSPTSQSLIPFDVQLGITFKPEHMPLRLSFTAYNLTRLNPIYYDPNGTEDKPSTLDKVLSHFNVGAELLIHRNFNILAGYNILVHKAFKLENTGGGAGFSLGLSAHIRSFEFIISRSSYVVGNAAYSFTILTNLKSLLTRR